MIRMSRFNIVSVTLGMAFLYIPILLLIIYSFNASKLVTVWGGFSLQWYVSLFQNRDLREAAWVTLRIGFVSATVATVLGAGCRHAGALRRFRGRTLFSGMIYAPLVMPDVITGLSLLLLFVAMGFTRLLDDHHSSHHLHDVLRGGGGAFAPAHLRCSLARRRSTLAAAVQDVHGHHVAAHLPGRGRRLDAGLHVVAG